MTISIKEQVPTISAAIRLMVAGLREIPNEDFVVRMSTFGVAGTREGSDKRICYGCAATCALQKLAGKRLDPDTVGVNYARSMILGFNNLEMIEFENVIDELRQGLISHRVQSFFGLNRVLTDW